MTIFSTVLSVSGIFFTFFLSGCGDTTTSVQRPITVVAQPPVEYTWATAATGPDCLRRLRTMMHWYETHTEEFRQATFVDGQPVAGEPDDAPPEPEGPFSVAEKLSTTT